MHDVMPVVFTVRTAHQVCDVSNKYQITQCCNNFFLLGWNLA